MSRKPSGDLLLRDCRDCQLCSSTPICFVSPTHVPPSRVAEGLEVLGLTASKMVTFRENVDTANSADFEGQRSLTLLEGFNSSRGWVLGWVGLGVGLAGCIRAIVAEVEKIEFRLD